MTFLTYPHIFINYPQFNKQLSIFKIHIKTQDCLNSSFHLSTPPTTSTTN